MNVVICLLFVGLSKGCRPIVQFLPSCSPCSFFPFVLVGTDEATKAADARRQELGLEKQRLAFEKEGLQQKQAALEAEVSEALCVAICSVI